MKYLIVILLLIVTISRLAISQQLFKNIEDEYLNAVPDSVSPEIFHGSGFKKYIRWKYFVEPRFNSADPSEAVSAGHQSYLDYYKKKSRKTDLLNSSKWTFLGPKYYSTGDLTAQAPGIGRVDVIRFHPDDENTIFIGTPTGGLWKTTDAGTSWTCLTDKAGLTMWGVADLVFDPHDPDHMFMATGDGDTPTFSWGITSTGVFETTDGGTTWEQTNFRINVATGAWISRILPHPTKDNVYYVSFNGGIYKTSDGFYSALLVLNEREVLDIEFMPGNPEIVYACTKSDVFKSAPGGESFQSILTFGGGFKTRLAVTEANPDYIYVCVAGSSALVDVYKSEDAGSNFYRLPYDERILQMDFTSWYYVGSNTFDINASPLNPDEVYVGSGNLYRYSGSSWEKLTTSVMQKLEEEYVHGDVHELVFDENGQLFIGCDGGFYKKELENDTFTDLSNGLEITQIYKIGFHDSDPDKLNIGTQDNGQMEYKNSGNWEQISGSDGWMSYYHPTEDITYTSTVFGHIIKITDNGTQSSIVLYPGDNTLPWGQNYKYYSTVSPYVMHPKQPDILYAAYDDIYRSDDAGNSWAKLTSMNRNFKTMAVSYSDPDVYYFATYDALYYTEDNCSRILNRTPGLTGESISDMIIDPADHNRVWICFSGYSADTKVYYSEDSGINWINVSEGIPNFPLNCLHYIEGSDDEIYAGTDVGVFVMNKEMKWTEYDEGLPNIIVYDLAVDYTNKKLSAGTFGRGLWEAPLLGSGASLVDDSQIIRNKYDYVVLYPNPAKSEVRITLEDGQQILAAAIFDLTGKHIKSFEIKDIQKGHLILVDIPNGQYYLKIATENARYTKILNINR